MTAPEFAGLVGRYRQGLLVDTNLLAVYLIGAFDVRQLANCQATKNFEPHDFRLLARMIRHIDRLITTPHILTEVSNLTGRLPARVLTPFRRAYARAIQESLHEETRSAAALSADAAFPRLGLADTAITALASHKYLVLSDDLDLFLHLSKGGADVINFNHVRLMKR